MLLVDKGTKEVYRLHKGGKEKICVIDTPSRISISRGSDLTLGGVEKCLAAVF